MFTVQSRPIYASNAGDGCQSIEMATGDLCTMLSESMVVYRPNNSTCWYNKTNLNTNSNLTKFKF